jgi:hypothetical protein
LKIAKMDYKWQVNALEFSQNGVNSAGKSNNGIGNKYLIKTKTLIIVVNVVFLTVLAIACLGLLRAVTERNFKSYNYSCSKDIDCKSGLVCQNNLCACKTTEYFDDNTCGKIFQK